MADKKPARRTRPSGVWRFTELMSKAEDVLGTRERAVEWMLEPAVALEHRRPKGRKYNTRFVW